MDVKKKYLKLMPLLLIIGIIAFITADQIEFHFKQTKKPISTKDKGESHLHKHGGKEIDHKSPEAQKRMGIYHYNEGNKFLKQNRIEEAIRNYKMALQHNKDSEETYINLSTAYLNKKKLKLSLETLKTLETINPKHPLLHYNYSCYYSLVGDIPKGIQSLNQAISYGFKNYQTLKSDPDIDNLRQSPKFKELQDLFLARK
jgi:tetratricopeptide (TPR) repeat protein